MFETLEARRLLSGSAANFSDGSNAKSPGNSGKLDINGASSTDNNFVVTELNTPGTILVQNLVTGEEALFTGIGDVKINLGNGFDTIFYNGNTAPAHIHTGAKSDAVTILDRGDVSSDVDTGEGNDEISIVYSHNASVKAGGGDDVITVNAAAGAGATIYDYADSDIMVDGGGGNDTVIIYAGDVNYKGQGGTDTLIDASGGSATYQLKQVELVTFE